MNEAVKAAMQAASKAVLESQSTDLIYGVRAGASPIAPWPTEPCKIVFLDFDGVLNCEQSNEQLGTRYRFSPGGVGSLNEILQQTGAWVVITSSWRENWSLRENAEFLERDGVLPNRVIGKTPALNDQRGHEIAAWLHAVPYLVESFVILDDRTDMAACSARLVQVNPQSGLSLPQARQAIELLNTPWSS
jgi:hypothetical protein